MRADGLGQSGMCRDVVIFESSAFSLEPTTNARGQRSDLPLGLDIAARVKYQLQSAYPDWKVSTPIAEDFGTVVPVNTPGSPVTTYIVITWVPIRGKDNCWAIQFQQGEGCLRSLLRFMLGGRLDPKALETIKDWVGKAIWDDSDHFSHPKWLTDAEFRRIASC